MEIKKTHPYIRWVLGVFILFTIFQTVQFLFLHFVISRNFVPRYFQDRQDLLYYIKKDIVTEAKANPNFDIKTYIAAQNHHFKHIKLDFISKEAFDHDEFHDDNPDGESPGMRKMQIRTLPIAFRNTSGYLVLYSTEFNRVNAGITNLSVFILISLFISLIIGFFIFRTVNQKSSQLIKAAQKVSQGDYSVRVHTRGNDELDFIGRAFNDMASSIEKSTRELKALDLQRRRFIADISHELATPLTSMKGYVETLRMEDFALSETEKKDFLKIIWDESERLSFLVSDLLELARMEAGTISLEKAPINGPQFLTEFAKRNALHLKEKLVTFTWEAHPGQFIYADYRRLEQIFQNLLDNALKHSVTIQNITVTLTESDHKTIVTFQDDGAGIEPEHLRRLFERFYQAAPRPDDSITGSGLGLAIVKHLVELHGGLITVSSEPEQGTVFTIEFPNTMPV
jgi:signal transduction histidine kinase